MAKPKPDFDPRQQITDETAKSLGMTELKSRLDLIAEFNAKPIIVPAGANIKTLKKLVLEVSESNLETVSRMSELGIITRRLQQILQENGTK